ncbi:MAG: hypothetical protein GY822_23210 [Deltaproteobacteria bacterium]|nr:hypothetical protein [Deltaproteobacteria bacterium]
MLRLGTFELGGTSPGSARYPPDLENTFATNVENVGTLTLDVFSDTEASGAFAFTAINGNNPDEQVEVTEGAFSVQF